MGTHWDARTDPPLNVDATAPPRRRCGRLKQHSLVCNLGQIVDISAEGMQVRSSRRYARHRLYEIRLKGFSLPGPLWAMVVWSRRNGFFKHAIGLKFEQTSAEVIQRLTMIAGCGGTRRLTSSPKEFESQQLNSAGDSKEAA